MKNLKETGLNLRTLKIADLGSLIADINFNFAQVLALPAFKGLKGDTGNDGVGISGVRGSSWKVMDATLTASVIAAYGLTSANQITLSFVNTQISTNLPDFLTNFEYTELVQGDVLVLPDLSVIIYDEGTSQFEDTGITFANGSSLTVAQVQAIVAQMIAGITPNDSIDQIYLAVAKLYADAGSGINIGVNNDSVLDIPVIGAGGGTTAPDYQIIAPKESKVQPINKPMFMRGVPTEYHDLIQATLTNDTHDYAAGIDNTPIMTLLQNDYSSGIFMGYRLDTTMRNFAKIYKTSSSLRLTGKNELNEDDMTYLDLAAEVSTLYGKNEVILGTQASNGTLTINTTDVIHRLFNLNNTTELGSAADGVRLNVRYDDVFFYTNIGTDAKFLALSGNQLVDSGFDVSTAITDNDPAKLVTSDLLNSAYNTLNTAIGANTTAINNLIAQLDGENRFLQRGSCPQDLNNATDHGIYEIAPNTAPAYSNFPNLTGTLGDLNQSITTNDGGILLTFRYDVTKQLSINFYDILVQILIVYVPDDIGSLFGVQERGQIMYMRTASSATGSFNFSEWNPMYHGGNYNFEGEGLTYDFSFLDNVYTLRLSSGISSHTGGSTGVNYPTTAVLPYVENVEVDTHGRTHNATIGDLDQVIRTNYVPLDTWHNVGDPSEPQYDAGFVNTGAPDNSLRFSKFVDYVSVEGVCNFNYNTGITFSNMFQLPVGYRPTKQQRFIVDCIVWGVPSASVYTGTSTTRLAFVQVDVAGFVSIRILGTYALPLGGDTAVRENRTDFSITFPIRS